MTTPTVIARCLLMTVALVATQGCKTQGTVRALESEGNLVSEKPLACVPGDATSREHTPADILAGTQACIAAGEMDYAVELVMIASAYARYDAERVSDKSAGAALNAILYPIIWSLPEDEKERFQAGMTQLDRGNPRHAELCAHIKEQGPPQYYPRYMIAHGMASFLGHGPEGPLNADFDPEVGFVKALEYARCREPAAN